MIEVCKPIFVPDPTPEWETCTKNQVEVPPPHPYEVLLANELNKNWEASRMILFYNVTSMPEADQRQIRNTFHKKDLYFHHYSQRVVELALHNTPFASALYLFQSETALLFSEAISIDKVLKLSRKFPQVALMAGIIDNVFYSRSQLQALSEVLKQDSLQELAQFLDLLPSKLCGTVDHHTRMLCHYLGEVSNRQS
ncbi:hypothetical protein JTE90_008807 [Oedothorax gibbosus]|uniref:Large ribosomal subunit protein uL10m n=1 Tax=Oedothorax gibbosus TaxID=931172 RepID=A0AAV6V4Y9_9ARAC|nr:hypothetical protein JTE90_008807 [Oedothorax gibbosus]